MIITEVCAGGYHPAVAAAKAGAHRIELCENLESGGLTPSYGTLLALKEKLTCPVHVLIRPRRGDYVYDEAMKNIMLNDIRLVKSLGYHGVVIGALTHNGKLDLACLKAMTEAAEGLQITFHRAIDILPDPLHALDQLIELGIQRVLTSGGAATAWEGRAAISLMQQHAGNEIKIMAGSGINASNVAALIHETQVREIHLSAKSVIQSKYLTQFETIKRPDLLATNEWWHYGLDQAELERVLEITKKAGIC